MATISTTITHGITLGTVASVGTYTSPLTITSTGAVEASSGNAIDGPAGNAWTLVNQGLIEGATGVYIAGTVTNSGTIVATGGRGIGVQLAEVGSIDNTGLIEGTYYDIKGGGTVTNSGTIGASLTAVGVGLYFGSGVVNNAGQIEGVTAVYIANAAGTVTNSGSILGAINGVLLTDGGSVGNTAGLIEAEAGVIVHGAGTVTNSATIIGTSQDGVGVELYGGGNVSNLGTGGLIEGAQDGVIVHDAAGTVVNSGVIEGRIFLVVGGTIIDSGTISNAGTAVVFGGGGGNRLVLNPGAYLGGMVVGSTGAGATNTLELAGTVGVGTVSGLGTEFVNFGTVTVDAGANWTLTGNDTIDAGVTLGNLGVLTVAGTLTDLGTMTNAGTLVGSGNLIIDPASLVNSGSIGLTVTLSGGGYLDNEATGTIAVAGVAVYGTGGAATIVNAGAILGTGSSSVGISLLAGGSVANSGLISGASGIIDTGATGTTDTIVNSGTIAGTSGAAIALGGGTDRVVDFGTIAGTSGTAIAFGSGADTVVLEPGAAVAGALTGFGVLDTIDLAKTSATGTVFSGTTQGGTLTVTNGTAVVESLALTGQFAGKDFVLSPDGAGGVDINIRPPIGNVLGGTYGYAIILTGSNASTTVTSTGSIAAASGDGVVNAVGVVGSVTNLGRVTAAASGSDGVYFASGGLVTNKVGGAGGGYISGAGVGVMISGGGTGTVVNSGTIAGGSGVVIGNATLTTVTNAGTITGTAGPAIALGGGSNRLIVDPGAVFAGRVDGGGGSSVLEIAASSGSGSSASQGALGAANTVAYVSLGNAVNFTSLQIDNSATLDGSGVLSFGTLVNQGAINVASGDSLAFGTVASAASTGTIDLFAGGTVTFKGAVAGQALDFKTAGGIAEIDDPNEFGGTIFDFADADRIALATVAFDSLGTVTLGANNRLQISENGATYNLQLDPSHDFTGNLFQLTADGLRGTDITVAASPPPPPITPCYCRGTLILTERGEVPVEELAVGDRVKTLSGAWKPIVWIGAGRDLVTRRNRLARPVIVRRGALADEVPRRDLYLTHGHALYWDGVLIPVENLVNHRSILWDDAARVVEYYHIELADHDVVFAEGAPAETYHDAGNRALFQNAREGSAAGIARPTFAPVLQEGEIVEDAWAALFARAGGHLETDTTDDPDLHLLVDGERLDPVTADDGVYSFAVQRPPAVTLLLCSRSAVPSLLGLGRSDHRRLGVPIGRIVLWQAGIATSFDHDAPQLREGGSYPAEDGYSWTDGELALPARFFAPLNDAFTLVVHTRRHCLRYPIAPVLAEAA